MYAGFLRRFVAFILDSIIFFLISFALIMVLTLFKLYPQNPNDITLTIHFISLIVFILLYFFYYVFPEASPWQATLGKKILGIKVVDTHGHRISLGRSLGRNVNIALSTITFCVGFLMCLWTKKEQCLHDMVSGCMVVTSDVKPTAEFPPTKTPLIMWVTTIIILLLWLLIMTVPFIVMNNQNGFMADKLIDFEKGMTAQPVDIMTRISDEVTLQQYPTPNPDFTWGNFVFAPQGAEKGSSTYCVPSSQIDPSANQNPTCNPQDTFLVELTADTINAYRINNSPFKYALTLRYGDRKNKLKCIAQSEIGKEFCSQFEQLLQNRDTPAKTLNI